MSEDIETLFYSMYVEWKRLNGFTRPETVIDAMIDRVTEKEDRLMHEFSRWFFTDILPRLKPNISI